MKELNGIDSCGVFFGSCQQYYSVTVCFKKWCAQCKYQMCLFRHINVKLASNSGHKHCLKRIKIHSPTSTQNLRFVCCHDIKRWLQFISEGYQPTLCWYASRLSERRLPPPNASVWTKRKTHLDRVGSANSLTWGRRTQHSSTGCKVAGAMWGPVKQQWTRDKRGLLRLVQTSGSNLLPALCHSLWELKIVRHESDVISVFPTTRAEGIMLLVHRFRAMTTTWTEDKKETKNDFLNTCLQIISTVTTR